MSTEDDGDPSEPNLRGPACETELLELIAIGQSNRHIARTLNLGIETVEQQRALLMQSLRLGTYGCC